MVNIIWTTHGGWKYYRLPKTRWSNEDGLYSELARQYIVNIRKEISNSGIGLSDEDIKSFRHKLLKSDKDYHKLVTRSADFYSLSTLKDLLFHVQEHRFTIPQIKDCLYKLGLKFCGFEDFRNLSNFKQTNRAKDDPYDLDKWQAYEEANQGPLLGCISSGVRKPGKIISKFEN